MPGTDGDCPFCAEIGSTQLIAANDRAIAFLAGYPVSPGHTLIVPKRHEHDFFALTRDEKAAMLELVDPVRDHIQKGFGPDAYNVGMNAGKAAGQTIRHAHLHVIPRYAGDVEEPRGGIRWVLPQTAKYW